jgi:hypothetical protein
MVRTFRPARLAGDAAQPLENSRNPFGKLHENSHVDLMLATWNAQMMHASPMQLSLNSCTSRNSSLGYFLKKSKNSHIEST